MVMTRNEIVARVNRTLEAEFEIAPERVQPAMRLREDLELDSLDAVDLIAALEQDLKIQIDGEAAKGIRTVDELYAFVERLVRGSASA